MRRKEGMSSSSTGDGRRLVWPQPELDWSREATIGSSALCCTLSAGFAVKADSLLSQSQAVPTTDDPSLPTLTFRVVVLGSIFCIIGASTSQLFFFKSNPPSFSSFFVILCKLSKPPVVLLLVRVALTSVSLLTATYPLGNIMARYLPKRRVLGVNLNPGKFSIKGQSDRARSKASTRLPPHFNALLLVRRASPRRCLRVFRRISSIRVGYPRHPFALLQDRAWGSRWDHASPHDSTHRLLALRDAPRSSGQASEHV